MFDFMRVIMVLLTMVIASSAVIGTVCAVEIVYYTCRERSNGADPGASILDI